MLRVCTACGKEVSDAAFCPYCSQPTAERLPQPATRLGGALPFFRVVSFLLMLLGVVQFLANMVWFLFSDVKQFAGTGGVGAWFVFFLQFLTAPVLTFALEAVLWVLVEIAARLQVPK